MDSGCENGKNMSTEFTEEQVKVIEDLEKMIAEIKQPICKGDTLAEHRVLTEHEQKVFRKFDEYLERTRTASTKSLTFPA